MGVKWASRYLLWRATQALFGSIKRNDYSKWISKYDSPSYLTNEKIRLRIAGMKSPPLISILMPTYNSNIEWLKESIWSVINQLYPYWELCIADDASTNKEVLRVLEEFMKCDPRIKIAYRKSNGHISEASNSALKLSTASWIALLDHDDLLTKDALFWVADAIHKDQKIRLLYTDEDKIDESGTRFGPYFKPDWNQDLLYSHNYFCHLGVYEKKLVEEVGGFRVGYEGAQDYDLVLRCVEKVNPKEIYHIPKVCYHWRSHDESTAKSGDAKPYAMLAGEKALNDHMTRQKTGGVIRLINTSYRAYYCLPTLTPLVSIIIPTRNGYSILKKCIDSILAKTKYFNYEILVIDNGSDEPESLAYLQKIQKKHDNIIIHREDSPFNYSYLNNRGVDFSRGEIICLLNNDIEVKSPDWLDEMVGHALRPGIACVGAKLLYPNGTVQHGGVILGVGREHRYAGHSHKGFPESSLGYAARLGVVSNFSAVTGACLVIEKKIYKSLGGLNEVDLKVACNDVDLCLKAIKAGYRNIYTPYATLYHHESISRGYEDSPDKQARFERERLYMINTWGDYFNRDPAYNPNLTLDFEDFSLAWPPKSLLI